MKFITSFVLMTSLAVGCASVPLKQKISNGHQTFRQAVVDLDQTEVLLCVPDRVNTNHCTSALAANVGLTDQKHQKFSAALVNVYKFDEQAGAAIIKWKAGDPIPADVTTLLKDAQDALNAATDIGYGSIVTKAQTVVARAQAIAALFGK